MTMPLSTQQVEKFQELYLRHFDEEISDSDAYEKGERLIELIRLIRKPPNRNTDDQAN